MKPVSLTLRDVHTMIVSHCVHTLSIVFLLSVCLDLDTLLLMPQIQHLATTRFTDTSEAGEFVRTLMLCCVVIAPSGPPQELNVSY